MKNTLYGRTTQEKINPNVKLFDRIVERIFINGENMIS